MLHVAQLTITNLYTKYTVQYRLTGKLNVNKNIEEMVPEQAKQLSVGPCFEDVSPSRQVGRVNGLPGKAFPSH